MAYTYDPVATTTLTSAATSVTFSSISSGYTDLILVCKALANTGGTTDYNLVLNFNSDTGSNYSRTQVYHNGTSGLSGRSTNETYGVIQVGGYLLSSDPTNVFVNINNYSNNTTYKTYLASNGPSSTTTEFVVGLWRSTSAITSITVKTLGGQFKTGSMFTLYGIAAA